MVCHQIQIHIFTVLNQIYIDLKRNLNKILIIVHDRLVSVSSAVIIHDGYNLELHSILIHRSLLINFSVIIIKIAK